MNHHSLQPYNLVKEKKYYWGMDWSGTLQGAGGVGGLIGMTSREAGQAVKAPAYPLFDGNGNLMALYQADGTMLAEYEYSPYGRLLRVNGAWAAENPFRFATKYAEVETDLYYYQERYYSPEMGRFISRDPIGTDGGMNLYGFVNNNPVSLIDAYGQFTFAMGGGFGFGSTGFGDWGMDTSFGGFHSTTFESYSSDMFSFDPAASSSGFADFGGADSSFYYGGSSGSSSSILTNEFYPSGTVSGDIVFNAMQHFSQDLSLSYGELALLGNASLAESVQSQALRMQGMFHDSGRDLSDVRGEIARMGDQFTRAGGAFNSLVPLANQYTGSIATGNHDWSILSTTANTALTAIDLAVPLPVDFQSEDVILFSLRSN